MRRLLREPLLHFVLIGAALFGIHEFAQAGRADPSAPKQIQLSLDDLAQLAHLQATHADGRRLGLAGLGAYRQELDLATATLTTAWSAGGAARRASNGCRLTGAQRSGKP